MTDDDTPPETPDEDRAQEIRAARARAIAHDEAQRKRVDDDFSATLGSIMAIAQREFDAWQAYPCKGLHAADCSVADASGCNRFTETWRGQPRCPRRAFEWQADEDAKARGRKRQRAKDHGIPELVLANVFDAEPDDTEAMRLLAKALEAGPWCVILSGGVGCGKTTAAGAECLRRDGRFIGVRELCRLSPYDNGKELHAITSSLFLVIDDIGREYLDAKGFFQGNFEDLVDVRYRDRLATVFTTNLSADEFKARYGERVVDRIREGGRFLVVSGASLRKRA